MIIAVMGRSASGKDTIISRLLACSELGLKPLLMSTTRPMRDGEVEGKTYYFVTDEKMRQWIAEGKVIESRTYRTTHGDWTYGTVCPDNYRQDDLYIMHSTLELYKTLVQYFGKSQIVTIWINVSERNLLLRSIDRSPDLREACRRFIDESDEYTAEAMAAMQFDLVVDNNHELPIEEIRQFLLTLQKGNK